ncbi:MAG: hypothetical protein EOO59_02450, partial [Hymenobacter sp.]
MPKSLLGAGGIAVLLALAADTAHAQPLSIDSGEPEMAVASLSPSENIEALVNLTQQTADIVVGLTARRSTLILGTLPTTSDRSDRLHGIIDIAKSPKPLFDALPDFADGKA